MLLVDSEQADSYADSLDSPPEPWLPSLRCFYFDETSILSVGGESLQTECCRQVKLWNHISHYISRRICPLVMTSWCRLCCNPAGDVAPRCEALGFLAFPIWFLIDALRKPCNRVVFGWLEFDMTSHLTVLDPVSAVSETGSSREKEERWWLICRRVRKKLCRSLALDTV